MKLKFIYKVNLIEWIKATPAKCYTVKQMYENPHAYGCIWYNDLDKEFMYQGSNDMGFAFQELPELKENKYSSTGKKIMIKDILDDKLFSVMKKHGCVKDGDYFIFDNCYGTVEKNAKSKKLQNDLMEQIDGIIECGSNITDTLFHHFSIDNWEYEQTHEDLSNKNRLEEYGISPYTSLKERKEIYETVKDIINTVDTEHAFSLLVSGDAYSLVNKLSTEMLNMPIKTLVHDCVVFETSKLNKKNKERIMNQIQCILYDNYLKYKNVSKQ